MSIPKNGNQYILIILKSSRIHFKTLLQTGTRIDWVVLRPLSHYFVHGIRGFPASNIRRFYTHKLQTIYIQQSYESLHNTFIYQHLSDLLAVHTFLCNLFVYDCRFFYKICKEKISRGHPFYISPVERGIRPPMLLVFRLMSTKVPPMIRLVIPLITTAVISIATTMIISCSLAAVFISCSHKCCLYKPKTTTIFPGYILMVTAAPWVQSPNL